MKKFLAVVLAALMLVACFAGCSKTGNAGAKGVKVIDFALTEEEYAYAVKKGDADLLNKLNEFLASIQADGTFDKIINSYFGDGTPTAVKSGVKGENDNQLVVATNAAFAPFEYMDGADYYGIDMEIMAKFAEYLGKELVVDNMEFDSVCASVGNGQCDVAAAGLTVNDTRKEILDFSTSYYNAAQVIMCKADDTTFDSCKELADVEAILKGYDSSKKIGVQKGTTGNYYVTGDEDWGFDGLAVTCKEYSNGSLAAQDMLNGNIDLVIIDEAPAKAISTSINAMN